MFGGYFWHMTAGDFIQASETNIKATVIQTYCHSLNLQCHVSFILCLHVSVDFTCVNIVICALILPCIIRNSYPQLNSVLKLKTIHKYFHCPYKRQISMLRLIALRGEQAQENVEHSQRRENVIYSNRNHVLEPYYNLENKHQIMQNNV